MTKKHTKTILRIGLFVGTIVSLFFVPWPILKAWLPPVPDTVQEQVDKAEDYGFDGIIVYIDKGGYEPAYYTSGYKDRDQRNPADPNALFKIASVSKLYTALAITKLAYDGKISLDSSLAHYFPELLDRMNYVDRVTVRMMVRHRSGIPNFTDAPNYWAHPKETGEEQLDLVIDLPANFEPGTDYEYSNTNYLLLGKLIERATGESRFEYIKRTVLNPLNLKNTYGSIHDVDLDRVMSGYYVGYDHDLKSDDVGSIVATAEDLGRFIRALNDGSVFRDERERELYASIYKFEHTGLIPGYQTIAKYYPDIDAVVVQFTNTVDFEGYNWNMSEVMYGRIVRILERQIAN